MDSGRTGLKERLKFPTRFYTECDPSFRFEEEPHLYWLNEQILWSATGMLKAAGYVDDRFYTEGSAIRGKHIHKATQIIDGGSTLGGIAQEYVPYVEAWESFVKDWNFRPRLIEMPMYHPFYRYGVTPDREGLTDHPGLEWTSEPTIVEIKTGLMPWWTRYQTSLQEMALSFWDAAPVFRRRMGVQLMPNGTYNFSVFGDYSDLARAQSIALVCLSNENKMWQKAREPAYVADSEFI